MSDDAATHPHHGAGSGGTARSPGRAYRRLLRDKGARPAEPGAVAALDPTPAKEPSDYEPPDPMYAAQSSIRVRRLSKRSVRR